MVSIPTLTECLSIDLASFPEKNIWECNSKTEAAVSMLRRSFLKKFRPSDQVSKDQVEAATQKFMACNNACHEFTVPLNSSGDEELYGTFKSVLYNFFYPRGKPLIESFDQIADHGKLGDGANIGSPHTSLYAKLWASKLTSASATLAYHYAGYIDRMPRWTSAELCRSAANGPASIVDSSRGSFVPKNVETARLICTEPVLNMFYQLGIGTILHRRIQQRWGINFSYQPGINARLARQGSSDGSYATIDLESASDTISLNLLKDCIPREQLAWFTATRTKSMRLGGKTVDLNMISTMGNGFTFPLQTVIFASAVQAVYDQYRLSDRVSVFGDDIIVRKDCYNRLVHFLTLLGFRVNTQKSFNEGPFRESCGHDYYQGSNVRGVYVKALRDPASIYVAINRLFEWSCEHGVSLEHTISYLRRFVPANFVPYCADYAAGIKAPLWLVRGRLRTNRSGSYIYRSLEWVPRRVSIHGGRVPGSYKRIMYNPDGLVLAVLTGETVANYLTSRDVGRWKTKRRVVPFWDPPYESPSTTAWRDFLAKGSLID